MWFRKNTLPKLSARHYDLPATLQKLLEYHELMFNDDAMPATNSIFLLDENN